MRKNLKLLILVLFLGGTSLFSRGTDGANYLTQSESSVGVLIKDVFKEGNNPKSLNIGLDISKDGNLSFGWLDDVFGIPMGGKPEGSLSLNNITLFSASSVNSVDTDNDGVLDVDDLDSDNDGITDASECYTLERGVQTDTTIWLNFIEDLVTLGDATIESFESEGGNIDGTSTGDYTINLTGTDKGTWGGNLFAVDPLNGSVQGRIFDDSVNVLDVTFNDPVIGFGIHLGDVHDGVDTSRLIIEFGSDVVWDSKDLYSGTTGFVTNTVSSDSVEVGNNVYFFLGYFNPDSPISNVKVTLIGSVNDNFVIDDISYIKEASGGACNIDSDNDGVLDFLDSDSDNDGCLDVLEAGFADGDGDGILGSSPVIVDANGLVIGQGGYTGTLAAVTDSTVNNACDVVVINTPPTSEDSTVTINEDESLVVTEGMLSYSDTDGDALAQITINSLPTSGTLFLDSNGDGELDLGEEVSVDDVISLTDLDSGNLIFVPDADENGSPYADFDFTVNDGTEDAVSSSTITVIVTPVNDAPEGTNPDGTGNEEIAITEDASSETINLISNNTDPEGDVLTAGDFASTGNGTIVDNGDGTIDYTPATGFVGVDTIVYNVCDPTPLCSEDTLFVTVTGSSNTDPVAVDDADETQEDSTVVIVVVENDEDVDGDDLSVIDIFKFPTNGTVIIPTDSTVSYTPNSDFFGTDTLEYIVSDGNGGTDTAQVVITVNPVNDGPEGTNPDGSGNEEITITEGASSETINVISNNTDPEGDVLTAGSFVSSGNGTIVDNGDGTIDYTPATGFVGVDTVIYDVCDNGTPQVCTEDTLFVTVESLEEPATVGLEIPEGFSPNNDGSNDGFVIDGLEEYESNTLKILNRWGNTVYESDDYQGDWDGTSNIGIILGGSELPVGTYFYILDLVDSEGEESIKKGYVYLNR